MPGTEHLSDSACTTAVGEERDATRLGAHRSGMYRPLGVEKRGVDSAYVRTHSQRRYLTTGTEDEPSSAVQLGACKERV